jgi:alcohol dehydrogenase class IV
VAVRFEYELDTRVIFGSGTLEDLGRIARSYGDDALIVCGRQAMRATGILYIARLSLQAVGINVSVFDEVTSDPHSSDIEPGVKLARENRAAVVVGLGGGSAIDAAKAIAVAVDEPSVGPLVGRTLEAGHKALPVIAVPTTAGSGSEVSRGAILFDDVRKLKAGIRGVPLAPKVALIDPTLTATQPPSVALTTAFDALTHAVESYVARKANPVTDSLSLRSLAILAENIPRLASGTATTKTREKLSVAALFGGMTVASASTCLPHRIQQAMGSVRPGACAHGQGLALVYPAWLNAAKSWSDARFRTVAQCLASPDIEVALKALIETAGLACSPETFGFSVEMSGAVCARTVGNVSNDPIENITPAVIRDIYESMF